ncbi:MAG TPA: protease modulator HflK N-terminal domain-containing protein, partial [Rhizomicrobium sp.]|nr:protease modulator HflK N-terminal domain-containing protein [Rhizomicrobium sp.]
MPWNNQPGGANGQGPRGPWSRGPSSGGGTPPDFDDLLRRMQERLRKLFPEGRFTSGTLAGIGIGIIGLWLL